MRFESHLAKGIIIGTVVLLFNFLIGGALIYFLYGPPMEGVNFYWDYISILVIPMFIISILFFTFGVNYWYIAIFILSYFFAGLYCGRRWPELSRQWGIWLTIPLATIAISPLILIFVSGGGGRGGLGLLLISAGGIGLSFAVFLISSIGAYVGSKGIVKPQSRELIIGTSELTYRAVIAIKSQLIGLIIGASELAYRAVTAFKSQFIGLIIGTGLLIGQILLIGQLSSGLFFPGIFLFFYPIVGLILGYSWPNLSWQHGVWVTLPWIVLWGYALINSQHIDEYAFGFLMMSFILIFATCVASASGAKIAEKKKQA